MTKVTTLADVNWRESPGRAGYLGEAGIRGLGAFVFNFAIPPYVFRLMAETDLEAITEWGFLGGYLGAQTMVFATGAAIGRLAVRHADRRA